MTQFQKILFYADGSPWVTEALRRALALAQHMQARLTVCGVVERVTQEVRFPDRIIPPSEIERVLRMDCLEELNELVKKAGGAQKDVRAEVLVGAPSHAVVHAVIEGGHDLLVTGAQGASDPTPLLFGTVDMQMLRRCPCPVWVVKPTRQGTCQRILAAVGPEPTGGKDRDLNAKILDIGASLAALDGAELHVVHVWKPGGEQALMGARMGLSQADAARWLEDTHKAREHWLGELVAATPMSGTRPERHVLRGNASQVIPTLAKELGVDLIVMATVTHKGVRAFFIGSTAEHVLGQVQCSVLAVKPAGFAELARDSFLKKPANRPA